MSHRVRPLLLAAPLLLAGCESAFNADLAADRLDQVDRVQLAVDGVELRRADGSTVSVDRATRGLPDLLQFQDDTLYALVSNSRIDEDRYTGARLLLDAQDSFVERTDVAGTLPVDLAADAPYAEVAFTVEEEDRITLLLTVDLRLSLSLDAAQARYRLDPLLRAVRDDDAAQASGIVDASLLASADCALGAAVYAFSGTDVTPDERDGDGVEPVASAPALRSNGTGDARFRLRFLVPGRYTLALTCDGERENGLRAAQDALRFSAALDVELDEGEILDDLRLR